jgi:hypothetical protein
MDIASSSRMLALLTLTLADAGIACWEAKYRYNFWRPVTAIVRADEDDNPQTLASPQWGPLLLTPPFPAYPSGHSTFGQATADLLTTVFGTDEVQFEARSDALPGLVRSYESFDACAAEIGMSRIYGGIHYSFDNVAGKRLGAAVAAYTSAHWMLPLDSLPRVIPGIRAGGMLHLRVHGIPGQRLRVFQSHDLSRWSVLAEVTGVSGGALLVVAPENEDGFFRVEAISTGVRGFIKPLPSAVSSAN